MSEGQSNGIWSNEHLRTSKNNSQVRGGRKKRFSTAFEARSQHVERVSLAQYKNTKENPMSKAE